MRIELEPPFDVWRKGYLRTCSDGRKRVDLVNSNSDRTTVSYARYLKSIEVGSILSDEVEVDHRDGNKSNDDIDNLQVLTKTAHRAKTNSTRSRNYETLTCPNCGISFEKEVRLIKPGVTSKCSRRCNALFNRRNGVWMGKV